jgi:hypothetical protein
MKTLAVIIPVSKHEKLETIQNSIDCFSYLDYVGFDARVVYCIDLPEDTRRYYQTLKITNPIIELLWVTDNNIKQSGNYNAGLNRYRDSDYYAFFDIGSLPADDFFKETVQLDADFVTSDRHMSNVGINSITKTISEEAEMYNTIRRLSAKHTGKCFIGGCMGLIKGKVFENFRFTVTTAADDELYRHLLINNSTFEYAINTHFDHIMTWKLKELWNQRMRWFMDAWRLSIEHFNISLYSFVVSMSTTLPIVFIIASPLLIKDITHIRGYNILLHLLFLHIVSIVALIKVIRGDKIGWKPNEL